MSSDAVARTIGPAWLGASDDAISGTMPDEVLVASSETLSRAKDAAARVELVHAVAGLGEVFRA